MKDNDSIKISYKSIREINSLDFSGIHIDFKYQSTEETEKLREKILSIIIDEIKCQKYDKK